MERNITTVESAELSKEPDAAEIVDIEQHAKDQILKYVGVKFSGHDLARLVESILKSQGYITTKSEPGKDGGIDILAGSGSFGFNEPRICAHIQSFFDKFSLIIPDISPKRYDLR